MKIMEELVLFLSFLILKAVPIFRFCRFRMFDQLRELGDQYNLQLECFTS